MTKKLILFIAIFVHVDARVQAQAPSISWQACLGGSNQDNGKCIRQTTDGGYIVTGNTNSNTGMLSNFHGGDYDVWVAKLNAAGTLLWQKCYGGSFSDEGRCVQQTTDGGYFVTGYTFSSDGDVTGFHGTGGVACDMWVLKLDDTGKLQWQKALGGTEYEEGNSILQTPGGYIVCGYTNSLNGDVTGLHSTIPGTAEDAWVVALDDTGHILWQKCYGGSGDEQGHDIIKNGSGGYMVTGYVSSTDGGVTGLHSVDTLDGWLFKINTLGVLQWQKCYGGSFNDMFKTVQKTIDGGYILAGTTLSNNGDVSGYHSWPGTNTDAWVVKTDSLGAIQWQKCLGGGNVEETGGVIQCSNGSYLFCGGTWSTDLPDVSGLHGDEDLYLAKLDSSGNIGWHKCMGGTVFDYGASVIQTADGGYAVTGSTNSPDGDLTGYFTPTVFPDAWVFKLGSDDEVPLVTETINIKISPNPTNGNIKVSGTQASHCNLVNLLGQGQQLEVKDNEIDLSAYPAGVYFLKVYDHEHDLVGVEQIVKQ